jgi:hypothetical protein
MTSVLTKNADTGSVFKSLLASGSLEFTRPILDVDGISSGITGTNLVVGTPKLMVQGSGGGSTELGAYQGTIFYCAYPFSPDFTCGTAADTFSYEINGWDHFGDPIQEKGIKSSAVAQVRCFRVFSAISSVYVTGISGTGTLTMGFSYTAGAGSSQRRWPLPFKLDRATYLLRCHTLSAGGQTPPTAQLVGVSIATTGGAGDSANEEVVLAQNNTLASWTPRKLAQLGIGVTTEGGWTAGSANTAPSTMRWIITPSAVVNQ